MIFKDRNVRMFLYRPYQAVLYFRAGVVFVVQYAEFGMPAFSMQVEVSLFVFIKINPPADQLFDLLRRFFYYLLYGSPVAQPIARDRSQVTTYLSTADSPSNNNPFYIQ